MTITTTQHSQGYTIQARFRGDGPSDLVPTYRFVTTSGGSWLYATYRAKSLTEVAVRYTGQDFPNFLERFRKVLTRCV
jgi:hypothetical protein